MEVTLDNKSSRAYEQERLTKLYNYNIAGNYDLTGTFMHVVAMATHLFKVPVAMVNFVDDTSVLANSSIGLNGYTEVKREVTLCSQAILRDEVTIYENAKADPCLYANPYVYGDFGLQFYAAAPLKTPEGFNIGVVAIVDKKSRTFSEDNVRLLEGLASIVMEELEERKHSLC